MTFVKMTSIKRNLRAGFLVLTLAGLAGLVSARAQDQTATPRRKQESSDSVQKQKGIGQELVHETREAAGEETDENAVFKRSASVQLISKWTGLDLRRAYWLSVLTNFAVIAGVIFWAGRRYLPGIFRDRNAAIQKAMAEAQKASEEARRKLADIEARLAKLDAEMGAIRDTAEKEGEAEVARIQAAAQEDARKIISAAEQEIAAAAKSARRELTTYAADLAVALAQKQIRVDAATDQALVRSFSGQLSVASDHPSGNSGKDGN